MVLLSCIASGLPTGSAPKKNVFRIVITGGTAMRVSIDCLITQPTSRRNHKPRIDASHENLVTITT